MERLHHRELENPRYELIPMKGVEQQLAYLPPEATVTVTSSPNKGIEATLDLAKEISERGYQTVPHLAARAIESEGHLDEILGQMRGSGIKEAFLVGGDNTEAKGEYGGSLDLAQAIREKEENIKLGSTGYPEGHPYIPEEVLMRELQEKQQFIGYIATQMCFDSKRIASWSDEIKQSGVDLPIEVGIPGAVDRKKLVRIAGAIGVDDSISFLKKNWRSAAKLFFSGQYEPTRIVKDLKPRVDNPNDNINGYHIYTFNAVENTENWRKKMIREGRNGQ